MSTELIVSIIVNGVISISSVVGNIIIAKISKTENLEEQHKFKQYIPKYIIDNKSDEWIKDIIDRTNLAYVCKSTQRYILRRYKLINKNNLK